MSGEIFVLSHVRDLAEQLLETLRGSERIAQDLTMLLFRGATVPRRANLQESDEGRLELADDQLSHAINDSVASCEVNAPFRGFSRSVDLRRLAMNNRQMTAAFYSSYANPERETSESRRLAKLLSLRAGKRFGDVDLANRIAEGLPPGSVDRLERLLDASGVLVPEATLRRVKKDGKALSQQHSERLYEVSLVIDALARVYRGNASKVRAFLHRGHPLLEGATPFEMARSSSAGARLVLKLLERAEAGVAA